MRPARLAPPEQRLEDGQRAWMPIPLPPLSSPDDGRTPPSPIPTGEEEWVPVTIVAFTTHPAQPGVHDENDVAEVQRDGVPFTESVAVAYLVTEDPLR